MSNCPQGGVSKIRLLFQKIFVQFFPKHDSPKGFIFITAGRDLRKTLASRSLPERQNCVLNPAFQTVLSAHRFRRSMTCGYENPAFQAVSRDGKQSHIIIYGVQILKFTLWIFNTPPAGH
jgi:hypothetical protein